MEQIAAVVRAVASPHPDVTLVRVAAPTLAGRIQPGQYVMARTSGSGWDPFLREPLFVAARDPAQGEITLWVPSGSETRGRLRQSALQSTLDLLGPLGSALVVRPEWRQILLVAEGLALGPLLAVQEQALAGGRSISLLGVTPSEQSPYPADALPLEVEYQRAARGGAGATAQEMLRWADGVVAAGSQRFYDDLAEALREARPGQRGGFAYGLALEPFGWQRDTMRWGSARVACGHGACRACLVPIRRARLIACLAGPAFDLWTL